MTTFSYLLLPSDFGPLCIVWQEIKKKPKIHRIFLPNKKNPIERMLHMTYHDIKMNSCPIISIIGKQIQRFLIGEVVDFGSDILDFDRCSEFQKTVLLTENKIPRGRISTYGIIARIIGKPSSARAVGSALAQNPFPIIIPCHRAIKSNGQLGGYQGGVKMKRALLEFEGIKFSSTGKVLTPKFYYG